MLRSSILWSLTIISGGVLIPNPKSLLDNRPLRKLIKKHIRFSNIEENLNQSNFESLAITTASYKSRKSCTFFQSNSVSTNWQRFLREGKVTKINLDHLMASVALPLIFPAVQIDNEYYGDGAMRQATPLSPAIRLGAEKLFIISTHETGERLPDSDYYNRYPSFEKIAGYTLDALFADGLQSDIERLDRINQIIKNAKNVEIKTDKKLMKHLDYLIIAPSEDLNDIAQKHYKCLPLPIRALLKGLGFSKDTKSEMLSFLLFESPYTQELIELGYRDGMGKQEEIINFIE
jgi:NTE family protein